jgi:hypothetical protein
METEIKELTFENLNKDDDDEMYKFKEENLKIPHYKDYFEAPNGTKLARPFCLKTLVELYGREVIVDDLGWYHLFYEGRLVYIGMSKNLRGRLLYHLKNPDMVFDAVLIFPSCGTLTIEQVLKIETKLIKHYKPSLNITCINAGY